MATYLYSYRNRAIMDRHADVANLSCMPSQLTEMSARVAGVHLRQVSGSAGNVCSFQLRDGLTYSPVGQLFNSAGQANGYYKLPYVRATSGLYAQATGSATGTSWGVYYVADEESGSVSDTPQLMFGPTSIAPTIGSATVTHTRSTTTTALDNTPTLKTAQINEIAVPGARRVRNLFALSDAPATQNVTTTAETYVLQASGTGTITLSGTYVGSLVVAGNRKRLAFTATAGTLTLTLSGGTPTWVQLEKTTGNADTTLPSEYVSTSLSTPWHGAGVLDVKYFTTANGCTVDGSNVVTEDTGAALTGVKGVLVEPEVTESVSTTYYRDLSAWTTISGVPVVNADNIVGSDGLTLADKLTGDAAATTGKFVPTMTLTASSTYCLQSVQKAGTSTLSRLAVWDATAAGYKTNVDIAWTGGVPSTSSKNANATETYTHIGNGWYLISIVFPTGVNTGYQIYIQPDRNATSKYIYVDWTSLALESYPTSIRPGANRTATTYRFPTPAFITSGAAWSLVYTIYPQFASTTNKPGSMVLWTARTDGNNYLLLYCASGTSEAMQLLFQRASSTVFNIGGNVSFSANAAVKICITYSPTTGYAFYANGALVNSNASTAVLIGSTIYNNSLATIGSGSVYGAKYYAATLSSARAILETT